VKRPANVIGPSVTAYGVGSGSTGTRADLLICDDVVDVRSLHNGGERARVGAYFENNLMNLLEPEGRFWNLFTPWHRDDLNARLKKNAAFEHLKRAVGSDFEPIWEEKWPRERLRNRKLEIGSASFARGYQLLPLAEEDLVIRPEWVRHWREPVRYDRVILSVDPAVSTRANADLSALVVLGLVRTYAPLTLPSPPRGEGMNRTPSPLGGEGWGEGCFGSKTPHPALSPQSRGEGVQVHVLEATARKVPAPELVALIEDADRRWNPMVILFESNAAFLGIHDLLLRIAPFGGKLKSVTQSTDKGARVAAFSVAVENGTFLLKGDDESQVPLYEEMTSFPFGESDDLLDAAATGTAYLLDRREPRVWFWD
jgi:hypothetical protein